MSVCSAGASAWCDCWTGGVLVFESGRLDHDRRMRSSGSASCSIRGGIPQIRGIRIFVCGHFCKCLALAGGRGYIALGIAAAAALLFAILAAVFGDPMIIPVMGIGGGVLGGIVASRYLPFDSTIAFYGVSIALAVLGICIQYALKSSKMQRSSAVKQKKFGKRNR